MPGTAVARSEPNPNVYNGAIMDRSPKVSQQRAVSEPLFGESRLESNRSSQSVLGRGPDQKRSPDRSSLMYRRSSSGRGGRRFRPSRCSTSRKLLWLGMRPFFICGLYSLPCMPDRPTAGTCCKLQRVWRRGSGSNDCGFFKMSKLQILKDALPAQNATPAGV